MPVVDPNTTPVFFTEAVAGATLTAGQVSVANTATQIVAANTSRYSIVIRNNGTATVFLGPANTVTTANGHTLGAGETITFSTSSAIYGIVATGTNAVSFMQEAI